MASAIVGQCQALVVVAMARTEIHPPAASVSGGSVAHPPVGCKFIMKVRNDHGVPAMQRTVDEGARHIVAVAVEKGLELLAIRDPYPHAVGWRV